jgi:hypothetical protein
VTPTSRLTHDETAEICHFLLADLDRLDLSASRAFAAEGDEPLDRIRFPFEDSFDRSVPTVRHPASNSIPVRESSGRVPKEHALHVALDDDTASDHVSYSR